MDFSYAALANLRSEHHDVKVLPTKMKRNCVDIPNYTSETSGFEWTLQALLKMFPNLALIIDLTNTKKYYDGKQDLNFCSPQNEAEYIKIYPAEHFIPEKEVPDMSLSYSKAGVGSHSCIKCVCRLSWSSNRKTKLYSRLKKSFLEKFVFLEKEKLEHRKIFKRNNRQIKYC